MRLSLPVTVLLSTIAAYARAQSVSGVVVDPADRPVAGVVVLLVDSTAREAARALSNELGEFRLAGRPGSYRIRTLRIGFRPLMSEPFTLRAGENVTRRLALSGVAVSLDTIRTVGRSSCNMTAKDSALATWGVWEQVRAALTATQLTAGNRGIAATTVAFERTLDLNLKRIRQQTADIRSDFVTQPWRSLSPDNLHRAGYVVTDSTRFTTYYAPGLDMLLSNVFLEDHCLQIRSSPDPDRLGIGFEPTRDRRKVPEIRGTVWLDRKSSELRAMDFRYVNVSREQEEHAGGEMEFVRLRNGAWAVSRWNIRMPAYAERFTGTTSSNTNVGAREMRLAEIRMTGGELALVTRPVGRGRDTLWARSPLVLTGVVTDSVSGAAVRNARVTLAGTVMEGSTDAAGKFAIAGVLPGRYTLEVRTPSLDSVNAVNESSVAFTDSSTAIAVRVPSARQIAAALCGNGRLLDRLSTEGIVIGSVELRGDTAPPRNARVVAEWSETAIRGNSIDKQPRANEARTDARGRYRICGVPVNTALTFRATTDAAASAPLDLRIPDGQRFARADLVLDGNITVGAVFRGTVADSLEKPIGEAEILLPRLGLSARTNEQGEFRLTDIPAGTHRVQVRRLGYGPIDTEIRFAANQTVNRRILLSRVVALDSIVSTAPMRDIPLMEFDENRKIGLGRFYSRADLEKLKGQQLTTVMAQTLGVGVIRGATGNRAYVSSLRATKSACILTGGNRECLRRERIYYVPDADDRSGSIPIACYSRVYLDRTLMNPGSPAQPFDISTIPLDRIEAIEWYETSSLLPAQFMGQSANCGVLVLHTRRIR